MQYVTIKNGSYRNSPIINTTFPLVKPYQEGTKGGFITVDSSKTVLERGVIRIQVEQGDFEITGNVNETTPVVSLTQETDEEIMHHLKTKSYQPQNDSLMPRITTG